MNIVSVCKIRLYAVCFKVVVNNVSRVGMTKIVRLKSPAKLFSSLPESGPDIILGDQLSFRSEPYLSVVGEYPPFFFKQLCPLWSNRSQIGVVQNLQRLGEHDTGQKFFFTFW